MYDRTSQPEFKTSLKEITGFGIPKPVWDTYLNTPVWDFIFLLAVRALPWLIKMVKDSYMIIKDHRGAESVRTWR